MASHDNKKAVMEKSPQKPGLSVLHHAAHSWTTHFTGLGYGHSIKLGLVEHDSTQIPKGQCPHLGWVLCLEFPSHEEWDRQWQKGTESAVLIPEEEIE